MSHLAKAGTDHQNGFRREARLLDGKQFQVVFKQRQSCHGRFFSLHVCRNQVETARLGLAVSKKVSKRAVERNRLKRQVRDSFRLRLHELDHIDFVVVAKPSASGVCRHEIRAEIDSLWRRSQSKCEK